MRLRTTLPGAGTAMTKYSSGLPPSFTNAKDSREAGTAMAGATCKNERFVPRQTGRRRADSGISSRVLRRSAEMREPMAAGHSGSTPAVAHQNRWLTAFASLTVGAAFFAVLFWLLPRWLGFRVDAARLLPLLRQRKRRVSPERGALVAASARLG
jgi:hypothetical protein